MNKKIAVVSCFWVKNYGSVLQAYATQYKLTQLGFKNETINYDCTLKGVNKIIFRINCLRLKSMWIAKYESIKKRIKLKNINFANNIQIRYKCFDKFICKNIHLTHKYSNITDIKPDCYSYSAFLVGSDQLWLPLNVLINYYTLNFVPKAVNKVSYATSFGVNKIPKFLENKYKYFLKNINHISVRELAGKKIIKDLINIDVPIVCDPTLMLDAKDWMTIQKKEAIINEPYIFCYFLGKNSVHRIFAEKFKKFTHFKIVALIHLDDYVKYDENYADITPYDIDPGDFINLIRNAQYILTDSFHGTIFSIIYHKNFYIFNRFSDKQKYSTNSRIDSLLALTRLESRRLLGNEEPNTLINNSINYSTVDSELSKLKKVTENFLKQSLYNG